MRSSPFIAALGEKATNWENKLISMQDIMDVWMNVQSTWMYLEPIFSSEDIMKQMPVEGRNFKAVSKEYYHNNSWVCLKFVCLRKLEIVETYNTR